MYLIGIISGKDYDNIENELYKKLSKKEYNIINITNKTINNLKNIRFDAILIAKKLCVTDENKEIVKKILNNTKYLIINTDLNNNLDILEESNINVITYGFNSKTTITASSINTEDLLVCIQRNITSINNKKIEQQDKKIDTNIEYNTNNILGIIGILIIFEKI